MKYVTALIVGFSSRTFPPKEGKTSSTKYTFQAMETDLNGARIPIELNTFDGSIRDALSVHVKSGEELKIPFSHYSLFAGKNQYNIDSIVTNPEYEIIL